MRVGKRILIADLKSALKFSLEQSYVNSVTLKLKVMKHYTVEKHVSWA